METLVSSTAQSFIDLIFLACDGRLTDTHKLENVRDLLVRAENARRRGDTVTVIDSYTALAATFGDDGPSIYFLERSLEIAKVMNNTEAEMRLYHELGVAHEKASDMPRALQFHAMHRALADATDSTEHRATACAQLVRVHSKQGAEAERDGKLDAALEMYLHAVEAASSSGQEAALAETSYKAGRMLVLLDRSEEAVPHLQVYLRISMSKESPSAEDARAYGALAAAYLTAEKWTEASECLEEFIATAAGRDPEAVAEGHEHLGLVCARTGRLNEAQEHLQQAYDTRVSLLQVGLGQRLKLDRLRMVLGMVRASTSLDVFVPAVVRNDVKYLLHWKLRTAAESAAPATSMETEEQAS